MTGIDLLLTGIPRSGTTLSAAMIDSLEDSICLSEPVWQNKRWAKVASREQFAGLLLRDFQSVRAALGEGKAVLDRRNPDGSPVTNYFARRKGRVGRAFSLLHLAKPNLTEQFLLAMKHNEGYLAILPELTANSEMPIIAVVRHPVPTILSWRSLAGNAAQQQILPVSSGRVPALERHWPELAELVARCPELDERQVRLYDLFCARILQFKERIQIVRYEEIVRDHQIFAARLQRRSFFRQPIRDQNNSSHYHWNDRAKIEGLLTHYAPHALELYPDVTSFDASVSSNSSNT